MNNSKSLKIIQVFAKIGKILSKIVYVFCIIGAVGCGIGIVSLLFCAQSGVTEEGQSLLEIIETESGMSMGTLIGSVIIGLLMCVAELVLAKISENTYKNELEIGQPFDFGVAKAFRRLGIFTFIIPIISSGVLEIAYQVITHLYENVSDLKVDDFASSAGLGLVYIVLSFIFQYGAELKAKADVTEINE